MTQKQVFIIPFLLHETNISNRNKISPPPPPGLNPYDSPYPSPPNLQTQAVQLPFSYSTLVHAVTVL